MKTKRAWAVTILIAMTLALGLPSMAAEEEDRIERLEREIAELKALLAAAQQDGNQRDEQRLKEIERRIEILATEVESLRIGKAAVTADESEWGLGPAASKIYRTDHGVSIGGYGEMIYSNFASTTESGDPSDATDRFDFLRAVVYVGYKFNERFLFNSELEFEHASTSEDGSVSVEFAYIDYLWREQMNVRGGLVLLPMGFINEMHEPITFPGATRPATERQIIPTTWRENGAGLFGELGPFDYRTYVVNGMDADGFEASGLRGGRQKGSEAAAEDFAWVARVDYAGTPGLLVGAAGYVGNSGQGLTDAQGSAIDVPTTIVEGHLEWRWRGLHVRLLGARARLGDVDQLNQALGVDVDSSVAEEMVGGYAQVGYDVLQWIKGRSQLIPFVRWEALNTQDQVASGYVANPEYDQQITTAGLSYLPFDQLIIKLDYVRTSNAADTGVDRVEVGLGYVF
jgi:hypothetical protein